jgi:hypothetical protein
MYVIVVHSPGRAKLKIKTKTKQLYHALQEQNENKSFPLINFQL